MPHHQNNLQPPQAGDLGGGPSKHEGRRAAQAQYPFALFTCWEYPKPFAPLTQYTVCTADLLRSLIVQQTFN